MKTVLIALLLCLSSIFSPVLAFARGGSLVTDRIHGVSLERNLLGDSPDRGMYVYLPPDYGKRTKTRYPVIYLLHGYNGPVGYRQWTDWDIREVMDASIASGTIRPMIVVMPDGTGTYWGSFYTNSVTMGNWEDFITVDLVNHIDGKYRTVPNAASRGIAGHSMGAYGALKLAMKHPDIYGAVYGMSSCCTGKRDESFLKNKAAWDEIFAFRTVEDVAGASPLARRFLALSAAWSPNPANLPTFIDPPVKYVNGELRVVDEVGARWAGNALIRIAEQNRPNLLRLRAIAFDVGTRDKLLNDNRRFSEALKRLQVPHIFEEYEGDHNDMVAERFEMRVLPFFSRALLFQAADRIP